MGEEAEIFKLEIDIVSSDDSRKRARQRDERHGGRQGSSGARGVAAGAGAAAATGGIRGAAILPGVGQVVKPEVKLNAQEVADQKKRLKKLTPSEKRAALKKSLKNIRSKAPRIDKNFFSNIASSTLRAAPLIGGALALGFFQVMNAERLSALDELTGNVGTLGNVIKAAREIKPRFEAAAKTISQTVDIGNAFGALGTLPPSGEFGELIPLLFKVNKAQSLQQFDLKEAMFRSAGSTVRKAIEKTATEGFVGGLVDTFRGGMRG